MAEIFQMLLIGCFKQKKKLAFISCEVEAELSGRSRIYSQTRKKAVERRAEGAVTAVGRHGARKWLLRERPQTAIALQETAL